MRKLLPVVITTLMIACTKNTDNPNEVNATDKSFLIQAYQAGKEEIRTGQLALSQSTNPAIKAFAQNLISGYTDAQSDLLAVASKVGFALTDTFTLRTQTASALTAFNGDSFDTAYAGSRMRSQMKVLSIFQNELNNGNNTYIRYYYFNKYIDQVRKYFRQADSLSKAL
jgi:putative membrane protein